MALVEEGLERSGGAGCGDGDGSFWSDDCVGRAADPLLCLDCQRFGGGEFGRQPQGAAVGENLCGCRLKPARERERSAGADGRRAVWSQGEREEAVELGLRVCGKSLVEEWRDGGLYEATVEGAVSLASDAA